MVSLGIVHAPCPGTTTAVSIEQPRDLSIASDASGIDTSNKDIVRHRREQGGEYEPTSSMNTEARQIEREQPYCQAYNLILTGRWMMVVPRSKARFDEDVSVNGLGE